MAKNLNLFFDVDGSPRARGPSSEKLLMAFLEADVQGSDHICHDLMDDITAVEDQSADSREFAGNAHSVVITADGVTIECVIDDVGDNTNDNTEDSSGDGAKQDVKTAATSKSISNAKPEVNENRYETGLKHFREVLEDWEAFILDDQSPT